MLVCDSTGTCIHGYGRHLPPVEKKQKLVKHIMLYPKRLPCRHVVTIHKGSKYVSGKRLRKRSWLRWGTKIKRVCPWTIFCLHICDSIRKSTVQHHHMTWPSRPMTTRLTSGQNTHKQSKPPGTVLIITLILTGVVRIINISSHKRSNS